MTERLRRLRALIYKEMIATLKEKTSRMILVGPIILYVLLFGYIASFNLDRVPYALCNMSGGTVAADFVRAIDNNRIFERVETLMNPQQIPDAIERGDAMLVVVIANDFAKKWMREKAAEVQIIIDGRNSTTAQLAAGYISNIAQAYNLRVLGGDASLNTRLLYNPNALTRWFIMPGLIVMLSMIQVLILSALSVSRERENGTFEQLLVTPYRTEDLVIAKSVIPLTIGLLQGLLIFLVNVFWFEIPLIGSVFDLFFVLFVFMLSVVGMGLAISAYSETMQQSFLLIFVFMVPMVILSGLFAPVQNMPGWIQVLTYLDPLQFALIGIRRVYLVGISAWEALSGMMPVVLAAVISLPVAYYFFKKRL